MLLQKRTATSFHGTSTASLDLSGNDPQVFFTNPTGLPTLKYSDRDQTEIKPRITAELR